VNSNIVFGCAFAGLLCAAQAQASSKIESAGTYVAIALPVMAGGITVWKDDWRGTAQLFVDTGLTVGTALVLKKFVREQRPDHSDFKSFPSDTSALAFAPAQFLWDRYGWKYGLPAYAAAAFVGYSRVDAKKHHVWDVLASAAISFGYSKFITTEYHPNRSLYTNLEASPDGVYASLNYRW
jgi:membrane-associated phospholipid phosphatase